MLDVAGHGRGTAASDDTRESLRVRFRKVTRLLRRWKAEVDEKQADWSVSEFAGLSYLDGVKLLLVNAARQPLALDNVFTQRPQPATFEALLGGWTCLTPPLTNHGTSRLDAQPAPVPFFAKAVAVLDVAIRVGHYGLTAVHAAVMDLWSRRHVIPKSDVAQTRQPRQRRAIDRLCLALMRFVVGFFGSHKVDARNNP
ncbi:hypothetical protein BurJ1DRAFT_0650 [Burkholderiales bacterium JOSHI_001]|nr:hypothetical protein BurJ1DRAFT_0650 [Burkholderiales bacterium JOSHI_001]